MSLCLSSCISLAPHTFEPALGSLADLAAACFFMPGGWVGGCCVACCGRERGIPPCCTSNCHSGKHWVAAGMPLAAHTCVSDCCRVERAWQLAGQASSALTCCRGGALGCRRCATEPGSLPSSGDLRLPATLPAAAAGHAVFAAERGPSAGNAGAEGRRRPTRTCTGRCHHQACLSFGMSALLGGLPAGMPASCLVVQATAA